MSTDHRFPVAVVMQSRLLQRGGLQLPQWDLLGFVAGTPGEPGAPRASLIRKQDDHRQWLWRGFELCLHRDSAESYWYNLVGRQPSLFLICRQGLAQDELQPYKVTADYDQAGAHMEADDVVFAGAIPPEIHVWLERFVMQHYRPTPPKKRKRTNWTEEERDAAAESPRLGRP